VRSDYSDSHHHRYRYRYHYYRYHRYNYHFIVIIIYQYHYRYLPQLHAQIRTHAGTGSLARSLADTHRRTLRHTHLRTHACAHTDTQVACVACAVFYYTSTMICTGSVLIATAAFSLTRKHFR
jgi:hypothetical protein